MVALWRGLVDAKHGDPAFATGAIALATVRIPVFGTEEQVRLQHQLLRAARRLRTLRDTHRNEAIYPRAHAAVLGVIARTAPAAAALDALGASALPEVAAILGVASGVTQRSTRTCGSGNSIHTQANHGLLAFRPLRAGTTRSLVAQLVAIDALGHPHITPLVDHMELRLGNAKRSPACIVEAGDDGVLRTVTRDELGDHSGFVTRTGSGVACASCHYDAGAVGARDLDAFETANVDALRDRQVVQLATTMWTWLNERP